MKHYYMMVLAMCVSLSMFAQIPTNGLVAHYTFESNYADQSGNGLNLCDGTSGVQPIPPLQASGNPAQEAGDSAAYFSGLDFLDAGCTSVMGEFSTGSASISAWFKIDEFQSYNTIACVRYNDFGSPYNSINLFTGMNVGERIAMAFSTDNTMSPLPMFDVVLQGTTDLETGVWYHAACTFDAATGLAQVYLNGLSEGFTETGTGNLLQSGQALTIGHVNDGIGNNAFIGMIDEVLYYDRFLTATEVCQIYGSNCSQPPVSPTGFSVSAPMPDYPNNIYLVWNDTSSNEDGFNIERSTDGVNFSNPLGSGFVPANTNAHYDYVTSNGTYYYRVCAFNEAGSECTNVEQITVTGFTSIEENELASILVYPNPASSQVQIKSTVNTLATVTNALGEVVMQFSLRSGTNSIDISALSHGVYTLRTAEGATRLVKH